jgi:hypothetical protein
MMSHDITGLERVKIVILICSSFLTGKAEVKRRRRNIEPLAQCVFRWWPAGSMQDAEFLDQLSNLSKNASACVCQRANVLE